MKDYTEYKRQSRQMPQYVKDKISASLTGRKLSPETKKRISDGQRKAWAQIPHQKDVTDLWLTQQNKDQKTNDNGTETTNKL